MTRRKIIFLLLLAAVQVGLIWPIYPLFSGIRPFILGLPLSFFWLLVMLSLAFASLLWYYLTDPEVRPEEDGDTGPARSQKRGGN